MSAAQGIAAFVVTGDQLSQHYDNDLGSVIREMAQDREIVSVSVTNGVGNSRGESGVLVVIVVDGHFPNTDLEPRGS